MSLRLSELKKLHDSGLSLLYLRPKSKRPFEDAWTSTPNKKWDELENSFEKTYNVGVRLGKFSKLDGGYLACIDVDVKRPGGKKPALARLKEITQGKRFPTVLSGSGGGSRHLYCVTDKPFKMLTLEKHKGWEICVYSTGRQMVLPPSIHPESGMKYVWREGDSISRAPLFKPDKFITPRNDDKQTSPPIKGLDFKACEVDLGRTNLHPGMVKLIETGEGCEDRSASLMSVAMAMCRIGLTDNEILSVLSDNANWISSAAYDRRKGRRSAVEWLYTHTLLKARHETSVMRYFDNPPTPEESEPLDEEDAAEIGDELDEEAKERLPDLDGNMRPKPTVRNIVHILEHFMSEGLVGYDEFANRAVFLKDTIYGGKKGQELTDHDDLQLMHYIACHYRFEPSSDHCFKAHALIAKKYRFHPVREYLSGLEWDGKPRLDSWLIKAFTAAGPAEYLRAISRKVLVAAVKRVYEPGCKFDYMMVLEGNQGKGKSMALDELCGHAWFTDSLGDIHNKDVVDQMTGKWIVEVAELASIKKQDMEPVKAFISRRVDRVRPPYGRRAMDFPRQTIFIGSTNDSEYLHDETGGRRTWPARISDINQAWIKRNRDQLWAEAVVRYELGEDIWLSAELEAVANGEQEKRFSIDEWEAEIKRILKKTDGPYLTTELWRAITMTNGHPSDSECKRISKIMRRMGRSKGMKRIDGVVTRCWM